MPRIDAQIVGAFAEAKSNGSPTAVILQSDGISDNHRRQIVSSVGCSHAAFVEAPTESGCDTSVRFFAPGGELPNCAHATIAVHFALHGSDVGEEERSFIQQTKSGPQRVSVWAKDDKVRVAFEQNAVELREVPGGFVRNLALALGLRPEEEESATPVMLASPGSFRFLFPVRSPDVVRACDPDFAALRRISRTADSIGCFVYSLEGSEGEFSATARMFAPAIGVDEDRVNGNSSGCLAAMIMSRSGIDGLTLRVTQGEKFGPPAIVYIDAARQGAASRITIGGFARAIETVEVYL